MLSPTFEDIQKARTLLRGVVVETPTLYSPYFSRVYDTRVFLKMENFQDTGSFKVRGAYIKLKSLSREVLQKGVIAVSSGNHAQAVAFHAHTLRVPATIFMPVFTPLTKVRDTEKWGATVILEGQTLDESEKAAKEVARKKSLAFIHPYDDEAVIAGQGTIGLEMLDACPELDVLLVPIGGGGLCAGIALAAKSIKPSLQIYGVEVEGYASMAHTLYGKKGSKPKSLTLAEGIAAKSPGKLPQTILKKLLKDILIVREDEIEEAVDLLVRKQNTVAEGAGATGLAGLLHKPSLFSKKTVGVVISGGNIDARFVSTIMTRGQIREGFLTLLRIKIQDVPGSLANVAEIIAQHQGNILEVHHQRLIYQIPIRMTELDIMVETQGLEHSKAIVKSLERAGFSVSKLRGELGGNGLGG